MSEIVCKNESYRIMGACFEVYKHMGVGFVEPVYQECLAIEFRLQGIPFERPELTLIYKEQMLEQTYRPDFVCFGKIIIELKAVSAVLNEHRAQVQNYLRASGLRLGILVNFAHYPELQYERIVR